MHYSPKPHVGTIANHSLKCQCCSGNTSISRLQGRVRIRCYK
ncbi:hypothetical protein M3J09_006181 [Ascochyta lentis]